MTVTVVDSTNLSAILADAGVEPAELSAASAALPDQTKPQDAPKDAAATTTTANAASEQETGEAEGEEEDAEGLTPTQRKSDNKGFLKAISKKHRLMKEAEEFAAHQYREKRAAEARAADLERQLQELRGATQPAPEVPKEPARKDFATEEEYVDAKIQWGIDQGIQRREQQRMADEHVNSLQRQVMRASEIVADFREVIERASVTIPQDIASAMGESDKFAELGYYFAKNPKEIERIDKLSGSRRLLALGQIEATLLAFGSKAQASSKADELSSIHGNASQGAPSEPPVIAAGKSRSDAPVIKPLHAGEGQQVEKPPEDMNVREMIAGFQKAKGVNLTARKRH